MSGEDVAGTAKNQSIRCTRAVNCAASQEAVCGAATGISPTSWPRLDVDGRTLARFWGVMLARKIKIVLPRSHPDEQPNSLFSNSSLVGTCRFSIMDVITLRSRLKV